jgi:hypothetical protein
MPPLESLDRYESALLWEATGESNDNGDPLVSPTPVEIRVRIVYKMRQSVDPNGNVIGVDAMMHANREIAVGSRVWEGSLSEWVGTGSSEPAVRVLYVSTDETALDIKGRFRRYQYGMTRHMATING